MNMTWHQTYYVWGQGLAVSAAIAAIPTLVLLYLLAVKRKAAWIAALAGLAATLALALTGSVLRPMRSSEICKLSLPAGFISARS